jgi:hypothetical protein
MSLNHCAKIIFAVIGSFLKDCARGHDRVSQPILLKTSLGIFNKDLARCSLAGSALSPCFRPYTRHTGNR